MSFEVLRSRHLPAASKDRLATEPHQCGLELAPMLDRLAKHGDEVRAHMHAAQFAVFTVGEDGGRMSATRCARLAALARARLPNLGERPLGQRPESGDFLQEGLLRSR